MLKKKKKKKKKNWRWRGRWQKRRSSRTRKKRKKKAEKRKRRTWWWWWRRRRSWRQGMSEELHTLACGPSGWVSFSSSCSMNVLPWSCLSRACCSCCLRKAKRSLHSSSSASEWAWVHLSPSGHRCISKNLHTPPAMPTCDQGNVHFLSDPTTPTNPKLETYSTHIKWSLKHVLPATPPPPPFPHGTIWRSITALWTFELKLNINKHNPELRLPLPPLPTSTYTITAYAQRQLHTHKNPQNGEQYLAPD